MNKRAFFDFDQTLYDGLSYFGVLEHHVQQGLADPNASAAAKDVLAAFKAGAVGYEPAMVQLLDIHARSLTGASAREVQATTDAFFESNADALYDYALPVIDNLEQTHQITLVTGEPQCIGAAACKLLGVPVDSCISSQYEISEGRYTGRVATYLAYASQKQAAIAELVGDFDANHSIAFGDSVGDCDMLAMVKNAVCVNASPGLQVVARQNNWHIPRSDQVVSLVQSLRSEGCL
jgi:Phosphoserine phosphatase